MVAPVRSLRARAIAKGLCYHTVYQRIHKLGWTEAEAFQQVARRRDLDAEESRQRVALFIGLAQQGVFPDANLTPEERALVLAAVPREPRR